jgi:hypothetical protein
VASWAYEFVCDMTLDELRVRLNSSGGREWAEGDSAWYGDYLGCELFEGVRLRVHDFAERAEGGRKFNADVRLDARCSVTKAEIDAAFREMLAKVEARGVREIEPYD